MSGARPAAMPAPAPTRIGTRTFVWGERTFVMGIVNVTPDSFSGDGLVAAGDPARLAEAAAEQAVRMVAEGADLVDVGGESTRPGHAPVSEEEERRRVVPAIAAIRARLPELPLSVDTTKRSVALAALEAGADLLNDVGGSGPDSLAPLAAERGLPIVLMHWRRDGHGQGRDVVGEIVGDLARAVERALAAGVPGDGILVDPGIGFGKTAEQNLLVLHGLAALRSLGRPILLGTSRKSTLGRVLDLPADERLEATLATTALGIAAGADLVRVHDVRQNVRAARMSDAIVRGIPPHVADGMGGSR